MKISKVTADTNIFYYLGLGKLSKQDFIGSSERLYATPINVIELLAGVGIDKWVERRSAAQAILDYADDMALDPDTHLTYIFDGIRKNQVVPWQDGCKALANANNASELNSGVADFKDRVIRKVQPGVAETWKNKHYDDFVSIIAKMCDSFMPGYEHAVQNNLNVPIIPKKDRESFRNSLRSPQFFASILLGGLGERYKLVMGKPPNVEPKTLVKPLTDLAPYVLAYGGYIRELLTSRRKPEKNDWGDLELFLYLQPNTFIATAEKKWWKIAEHANTEYRIKKIVVS